MNRSLDHDECSERLHAFAAGRLEPAEAEAVQAHLAGCARCRAEAAAVTELSAPVAGLSGAESEALRAGVLTELRRPEPVGEPVPLRSGSASWKGARLLAAAALLVIGVVYAGSSLLLGTGGEDASSVAGREAEGDARVADVSGGLSFRRPPSTRSRLAVPDSAPLEAQADQDTTGSKDSAEAVAGGDAGAGGGGGSGAGTTTFNYAGPPRPLYVRGAGRLSDRMLTLVGRYGLPMVLFPRAYTTQDAVALQEDFLVALANATETDAESQQVLDCGAQVLSDERPALPALATFGTYNGETIFVLALAWSETDRGPLDHFMVWTWPAGSCEQVPGYRAGRIGV